MDENQRCSNCKYAKVLKNRKGKHITCVINPPHITQIMKNVITTYPNVKAYWVCGKWAYFTELPQKFVKHNKVPARYYVDDYDMLERYSDEFKRVKGAVL